MPQLKLVPLMWGGVAGFADGWLTQQDSEAGRTEFMKQWSGWYEVALAFGGVAMDMMGAGTTLPRDVSETLMVSGAALLGRRASVTNLINLPNGGAYTVPYKVGHPATAAAAVQKQPSLKIY